MTRQDFSALLLDAKGDKPISQISYDVRADTRTLSGLFSSKLNNRIDIVLKVLNSLNAQIHLSNPEFASDFTITDYDKLIEWCNYAFEQSQLSQTKFAEQIGISRDRVRSVVNNKTMLMVDPFLKWAETTGYEVTIKPTE
jgi:predicted XRE-type DNA-binding protein